jgi:hypothetical protein
LSANLDSTGATRQLDRRPDPNETVTPDNVTDPKALARLITRILKDVTTLKARWFPRRLDFEDIAVLHDGTTKYNLAHNFGARVRWWPVDWVGDASAVPILTRDPSSDENILVLRSYADGKVTVRVEPAG